MNDLGSLVFSVSLVPVGPLALLGLLGLGFLWSFPLVFRSSWFPLVSFRPFYLLGFSVSLALVGSCGLFGFLCSGGSLLGVITNTSHGFSCGKKKQKEGAINVSQSNTQQPCRAAAFKPRKRDRRLGGRGGSALVPAQV